MFRLYCKIYIFIEFANWREQSIDFDNDLLGNTGLRIFYQYYFAIIGHIFWVAQAQEIICFLFRMFDPLELPQLHVRPADSI